MHLSGPYTRRLNSPGGSYGSFTTSSVSSLEVSRDLPLRKNDVFLSERCRGPIASLHPPVPRSQKRPPSVNTTI
jgi:hypothetical protein